jgi:hypothetical protein
LLFAYLRPFSIVSIILYFQHSATWSFAKVTGAYF